MLVVVGLRPAGRLLKAEAALPNEPLGEARTREGTRARTHATIQLLEQLIFFEIPKLYYSV